MIPNFGTVFKLAFLIDEQFQRTAGQEPGHVCPHLKKATEAESRCRGSRFCLGSQWAAVRPFTLVGQSEMLDRGENKTMPLCFVVGPIGKELTPERKHADLLLNAVIKSVLTNTEFGFTVKRADEDADPGMIGDRVISDIINADLVVADLTDLNPNAFYELGIRHSTEKPTIHMAKAGTQLPFDNVAHRTIFVDLMDWTSTEAARTRLAESVRATRVEGFKVSNPITQANASFKMRQSSDPKELFVSELQDRIAGLEAIVMRQPPTDTNPLARVDERVRLSEKGLTLLAKNIKEGAMGIASTLYRDMFSTTDTTARKFIDAIRTGQDDLAAGVHSTATHTSLSDSTKMVRRIRHFIVQSF